MRSCGERAGGQERRAHAEAGTRAAQAALEVEAEQRRAQDTQVASLEEIARLSLVTDKVEEESDSLISVMFQCDKEGLIMTQQADHPGMLLQERPGLRKTQHEHE